MSTVANLPEAIKGLYDGAGGNTLRGLTPGGLWQGLAVESVPTPVLVLSCPVATSVPCLDASSHDTLTLQFSGYAARMVDTDGDGIEDESGYDRLVLVRDAVIGLFSGRISYGSKGCGMTVLSAPLPRLDEGQDGYAVDIQFSAVLEG